MTFHCGGGANVRRLLGFCKNVTGLDYSEVSVEKTTKINKKAVKAGDCTVVRGDVSALPFENESFDLVTAFETVYFWQPIEQALAEVFRVLRAGGTFLLCNEADGEGRSAEGWAKLIGGMTVYNAAQLKELLQNAGFININVVRESKKGWLCLTAQKPC